MRGILLSAPGLLAESYAGPALARIRGDGALADLRILLHTAPKRTSREGAAAGLARLASPEAAGVIFDAALSGRIGYQTAGSLLARLPLDGHQVSTLLSRDDQDSLRLATEIVWLAAIHTSRRGSTVSWLEEVRSDLVPALRHALARPELSMAPRKRRELLEWAFVAGSDATRTTSTMSRGTASTATPLSSTPSTMTPSKLRAQPFVANFGGVGPATPPPSPDAWVILLVDVASSAPLSGLEIREIELIDQTEKVVARGLPPWSLRCDSEATRRTRQRWDYTDSGTVPFDGEVQPGQDLRLHVHAPLDTRLQSLGTAGPVRFRARLLASDDPGVWVEGALQGSWPTAAPVGPR